MTSLFFISGCACSLFALFMAGVYGYNAAEAKALHEEPVPLLLPATLILWLAGVILMGAGA